MSEERHASLQGEPSAEDQGTAVGQDELALRLSELARSLQGETDTAAMLDEVVFAAVALIPGVNEGSISMVTHRQRVTSEHRSGDLPAPALADAIQVEGREGPCLAAVFEHQTVRVPDMASEQRWPHFARRAAGAGAASMLAFQLYVEGDNLGALNLYSYRPNIFDK